ncbi:MAG TPA: metallophosphoesterase [Clostridia bacterium]|nr:metallophosphoesterase [Clostridia bacterium]
MQSDFLPISYHFDDDLTLYAISDLHIGSPEHQEGRWKEFRAKLASEPNSRIVIVGDMINNATRSSVSNVFEETVRPREQKRLLAEQLSEIRDKILCVTGGNHEARAGKDADDAPLYDVCAKLDIEDIYRDNAAFLFLRMGDNRTNGNRNPTYSVCCTHSTGGGIYTGAAVNRNERFGMMIDGLDVLITGHVHKGILTKPQKLVINPQHNKVLAKDFTVVSATPWMDYGGYALRKMLTPASTTLQTITFKRKEKRVEVTW